MPKFTKEDIGKPVKCACMGNGVIDHVHPKNNNFTYQIRVKLECLHGYATYTKNGRLHKNHFLPSLSFGHFEEDHNE